MCCKCLREGMFLPKLKKKGVVPPTVNKLSWWAANVSFKTFSSYDMTKIGYLSYISFLPSQSRLMSDSEYPVYVILCDRGQSVLQFSNLLETIVHSKGSKKCSVFMLEQRHHGISSDDLHKIDPDLSESTFFEACLDLKYFLEHHLIGAIESHYHPSFVTSNISTNVKVSFVVFGLGAVSVLQYCLNKTTIHIESCILYEPGLFGTGQRLFIDDIGRSTPADVICSSSHTSTIDSGLREFVKSFFTSIWGKAVNCGLDFMGFLKSYSSAFAMNKINQGSSLFLRLWLNWQHLFSPDSNSLFFGRCDWRHVMWQQYLKHNTAFSSFCASFGLNNAAKLADGSLKSVGISSTNSTFSTTQFQTLESWKALDLLRHSPRLSPTLIYPDHFSIGLMDHQRVLISMIRSRYHPREQYPKSWVSWVLETLSVIFDDSIRQRDQLRLMSLSPVVQSIIIIGRDISATQELEALLRPMCRSIRCVFDDSNASDNLINPDDYKGSLTEWTEEAAVIAAAAMTMEQWFPSPWALATIVKFLL